MAQLLTLEPLSEEDALALIVAALRTPNRSTSVGRSSFGADLYVPNVIYDALDVKRLSARAGREHLGMTTYQLDPRPNSRPFYNAAHSLALRGILAPTPTHGLVVQNDADVVLGGAYNLTEYGRRWLENSTGYEVLPLQHGRFSQLLASHAGRFGQAFHARSQEATSCYQAHTYLACCAMCGAAAESILLALAFAKSNDEARILRDYNASGGRSKVERFLLGQQKPHVRDRFANYMDLLKYWRDNAAHGGASPIDEEEAFTSLILLLRFAQFADNSWDELTSP